MCLLQMDRLKAIKWSDPQIIKFTVCSKTFRNIWKAEVLINLKRRWAAHISDGFNICELIA